MGMGPTTWDFRVFFFVFRTFSLPCEDPYLSCLEGRSWICFQPSQQASPKKGCLGWWLQSVSIFEIYEAGLPFSSKHKWEKKSMKNVGSIEKCQTASQSRVACDWMASSSWWSTSSSRFQSEILPVFFETNGAFASSLVMNCLPSCPVNDPSIWPTNKASLYPYGQTQWKKSSHFRKGIWCRRFWCFFSVC